MESYKHFLITRFNIVQDWYFTFNEQRRKSTIQTDEWLHKRIYLFEKYCFSSIINQTNSNFQYIVLFNSESPQFLKNKIKEWKESLPSLIPLFLEPYGDEQQAIKDTIISLQEDIPEWIITSRIDGDDMISFDYIDKVQNYAIQLLSQGKYNDFFVNVPNGYLLDADKHILRKWSNYRSCPFMTRCEKTPLLSTVMVNHCHVADYAHYEDLPSKKYLWVQVVHDCNVDNHIVDLPFTYFHSNTFAKSVIEEVNTLKYKIWVFFMKLIRWSKYITKKCLRLPLRIVKKIACISERRK